MFQKLVIIQPQSTTFSINPQFETRKSSTNPSLRSIVNCQIVYSALYELRPLRSSLNIILLAWPITSQYRRGLYHARRGPKPGPFPLINSLIVHPSISRFQQRLHVSVLLGTIFRSSSTHKKPGDSRLLWPHLSRLKNEEDLAAIYSRSQNL